MMSTKKKFTTFKSLREVHIGPQGTMQQPHSPSRGCNAIAEAVSRVPRRYKVTLHQSRAGAVRAADVVIAIGPVKRSFGKPTLKLEGEISPAKYSDKIRRFLKETGARSVAFALTNTQSYWSLHKTVFMAFNWTRPDFSAFSDEDRQAVRRLYEIDGWTQPEIADKFGVSQPAIAYIVTGYPDHDRFRALRKQGFVTVSKVADGVGISFYEAFYKAEQLGMTFHKVGPMFTMIGRKDARRLKAALQRRLVAREKRKAKRVAAGLTGYSKVADPSIPGWSVASLGRSVSGLRRNTKAGRK